MTYALIKNGAVAEYPVYEGDIRLRFPNTSFPTPFKPPAEYQQVKDVPQPQIDYTEVVIEETPVFIDDVLTRVWRVEKASPEVLAERTASKASEVRAQRNKLLASCDWTQLPDAPVDPAPWATYRQELRDVTDQPGFPWEITWPEAP